MKTKLSIALLISLLIWAAWWNVGKAQIIGQGNPVQQGGNATLNSLTLATPLPPNSGGVGPMTGAPSWARDFGRGGDNAGPASGSITDYKEYTSWTCSGAITTSNGVALFVRSQGPVALNSGCSITTGVNTLAEGDIGGAGGSGGSEGATNSVAASNTTGSGYSYTITNPTAGKFYSAGGGASSSSAGVDGTVPSAGLLELAFSQGPPFRPQGGGLGSGGANYSNSAGSGGEPIIIIAPSITIASGVILSSSFGVRGADAAALLHGGGGGGGAGNIWLISESFTDSGGIYKYGGGPGGNCTAPSISVTGGGCDTTGCGKDAVITISALTGGGGLEPTGSGTTITSGGTGYKTAPDCTINANGSGLTGSPACHFTVSGGAINTFTVDTAGNGGTFASYAASCQLGGYGANAQFKQQLM